MHTMVHCVPDDISMDICLYIDRIYIMLKVDFGVGGTRRVALSALQLIHRMLIQIDLVATLRSKFPANGPLRERACEFG